MALRLDGKMEDWGKRAAILIAFSLVLGVILVLARGIGRSDRIPDPDPKPEKLNIQSESPAEPAKQPPPAATSEPPAASGRVAPAAPKAPATPESLSREPGSERAGINAFTALFSSRAPEKDGNIDREKVETLVHDYLAKYRPHLKLSESDEKRLVDLVMEFRQANLKVRSAERSQANAPELKENIQKMQRAMDEFRKMTDVSQENILGTATPMPLFGDEATKPGEDPFERLRAD
jgi:hypothetical protein